ncbi:MAG TPA: cytochrome P450 [Actinophytocola sp.]|uniref:cytochrome P450 n=1 Tax=Actinophytocola sp. TaxID=1872138 RepID=UPI002DBDB947|nr:cytochrome P450 [Actinophytocola sp.]HEU5473316.1 cytochrome P450 [Actinophytocola sp.]
MTALPQPAAQRPFGHLWRWTSNPLALLEEGAGRAPVFELRLWRRAVVGYRPDWNRSVLGDLDTFRSQGSLSGLTPYLDGGVVHTDVPRHAARRRDLNPHFSTRALAGTTGQLHALVDSALPSGPFDALGWAGRTVRRLLNLVLFAGRLPDPLLAEFLAPLHQPPPHPLLPRPRLFRQIRTAIDGALTDPPPGSLPAALAGLDGDAAEELRIALAAGYDTTAHTLAWGLWHLAETPGWRRADAVDAVLDEVLRLHPAGWLGSRVTHRDTVAAGVALPAGTLVLYSPYLTHRDPELWSAPDRFRPERFAAGGRPAWAYLPFAAGRRTCLGAHLARLVLRTALTAFCSGELVVLGGDPTPRTGITLRPKGPLWLARRT